MTRRDDDSDRFDREQLDEWKPMEPADDFADRAMARIEDSVAPSSGDNSGRWKLPVVAFAAGAFAAAAVALLLVSPSPTERREQDERPSLSRGKVEASERQTVAIAERASVVVEPGASLSWVSGSLSGIVQVEQRAGTAFYRVEPTQASFDVETPRGTIHMNGACVTVDVGPAHTELFVHDGRINVDTPQNHEPLGPGERIRITRRGAFRPPAAKPPPPTLPIARPALAPPPPEPCLCEEDIPSFEAAREHIERWARECRVRSDSPIVGLSESQLAEFAAEITDDSAEQTAIIEVMRHIEASADELLESIYETATGSDGDDVPVAVMFEAVLESSDFGEQLVVNQRLSAERAGKVQPPQDNSSMSPYEELMRLIVGFGDELESGLAERLGAARARQLRRRRHGWPGPGVHMAGCPSPP